jgi:hypothetical protein
MVKSMEVITHWLAWNPGSGHSIRIGEDMILGLNTCSWLSPSLITTLKGKGIHFLYQARGIDNTGVILAQWKSSEVLGFLGTEVM